jgi:hypothetical protein
MPVRSLRAKQTPRIDRCLAFSDTYSRSIKLAGQASSVIKYKKFVSLSDPLTSGNEGKISKSGFNLLGVKWLHCRARLVTEADALISHSGEVLPVSQFQQAKLSDYFGQDP